MREALAAFVSVLLVIGPLSASIIQKLIEEYWERSGDHGPGPSDALPWLTFAVILGQLWIFHRQRLLMERQAKIMEKQVAINERLERPLILAFPVNVIGYKGAENKSAFPVVKIDMKNYGRSTAIVEYCAAAIIVGNITPPKRSKKGKSAFFWSESISEYGSSAVAYTNHHWTRRAIPPGEAVSRYEVSYDGKLSPAQIDEIGTGHQRVWVDGVVFYQDVFGTRCETNFRWLYDQQLDMLIVDGGAEFNGYT